MGRDARAARCRAKEISLYSIISEAKKSSEQWELEVQYLLKYKVGVNLLYPKIGEIRSVCNRADGSEFKRELCLMLCSPLNRKNMGISFHVRGITKWGRRDYVTAHGLRTDCQQ